MSSQALDRFTLVHGAVLNDTIEITNTTSSEPKAVLMQRLLDVSLAAFWEAFHEALCRETLLIILSLQRRRRSSSSISTILRQAKSLNSILVSWAFPTSRNPGGETSG